MQKSHPDAPPQRRMRLSGAGRAKAGRLNVTAAGEQVKQGLFFLIVAPESAILERQFCSVPDSGYLSVLMWEHTHRTGWCQFNGLNGRSGRRSSAQTEHTAPVQIHLNETATAAGTADPSR